MIGDLLHDDAEGAALDAASLAWLIKQRIAPLSLTEPWPVLAARVSFDQPGTYDVGVGEVALIFAVVDEGIIDLAAWRPSTGQIASRLGVGWALGQGQLYREDLGATGAGVPVHRSPISWLRAGRRGLVVIDWRRAAYELAERFISPEDGAHAAELRRLLVLPSPRFPTHRRAAA